MFKKKFFYFCLTVLLLSGFWMANPHPVEAATFINNGHIPADQIINDDVFIKGVQVLVEGTVNGTIFASGETVIFAPTAIINGDVFAAGQKINFAEGSKVDGSLMLGAQYITLAGTVSQSVYAGSATIDVGDTAVINRNLFYGGFDLTAEEGSDVKRNLYAGVYQAFLNGDIQQNALIGAGAIELAGTIGQNATFDVGDSDTATDFTSYFPIFSEPGMPAATTPGLRISEKAKIGGKLTYTSSIPQDSAIQAQPAGGIVYQTPVVDQQDNPPSNIVINTQDAGSNRVRKAGREFISLLLLGALALWLIPNVLKNTSEKARAKPLEAAGIGLLALIVVYAGAVLVVGLIILAAVIFGFISIGGLAGPILAIGFSALGLFMAVFSLMVSYGSKLVVAYLVGRLIMKSLAPNATHQAIWSLLAGILVYVLLHAIPFVGWLFAAAATLIGLGAMWSMLRTLRKPASGQPVETISEIAS